MQLTDLFSDASALMGNDISTSLISAEIRLRREPLESIGFQ
jgi:hypothetical protein